MDPTKHKTLLLLAGVFILLRSGAWLLNQHAVILADSRLYLDTAYAIKQGDTLQSSLGNSGFLVRPLYLYVMVLVDHFHLGFRGLVLLQNLIGLLCGVLIYRIVLPHIGKIPAILIAAFYWLSPAILFYEHAVMTEMLFSLFFFMAVYALFKFRWAIFMLALVGLNATKPVGKIFTLIFLLCLMIIHVRRISAWIRDHPRTLLFSGITMLALVMLYRMRSAPPSPKISLSGVVMVSLSPILDMSYPPIEAHPALKGNLTPGMHFTYGQTTTLFGYRVPSQNGGFEYINYNYSNSGGLLNALDNSIGMIQDSGRFIRGWIWYSIRKRPAGFFLFMATQVYNAVVMMSGSFLDHAPDFFTGDLLYIKRPLLERPIDVLLAERPQEEKMLAPRFMAYFSALFDMMRYKRVIMLLFRGLFGLASLIFFMRLLRSIGQRRFYAFIDRDSFSIVTFVMFYLYALAVTLTSAPLGRYFMMLFSLCMAFTIKEAQRFLDYNISHKTRAIPEEK